jgi:hypothetical protein
MTSIAPIQDSQASTVHPLLRIVDPLCEPNWDKLVESHPHSTFFHSAAWARVLSESYGFNCRYVLSTQGSKLHALLPLIEAKSWLRGARGISLPFTDECPALLSPGATAGELLEEAKRQGEARRWSYLELRGGLEWFPGTPASSSYFGHVLELGQKPAQLLSNCDSAVRRAVRKAEREGAAAELGTDLEKLRDYYKLHCRTRARLGAPPQPWRFFDAIYRNVLQAGRGFVSLVRHHGRPVAGAVFFTFAQKALYKFSASDERFQHVRGPNMAIWSALQHLAGFQQLNFGRTSMSNEGLRRFKLGWGSREYVIPYARYLFSRACFVAREDRPEKISALVFSFLPMTVSRWIGRAAYPHMS